MELHIYTFDIFLVVIPFSGRKSDNFYQNVDFVGPFCIKMWQDYLIHKTFFSKTSQFTFSKFYFSFTNSNIFLSVILFSDRKSDNFYQNVDFMGHFCTKMWWTTLCKKKKKKKKKKKMNLNVILAFHIIISKIFLGVILSYQWNRSRMSTHFGSPLNETLL